MRPLKLCQILCLMIFPYVCALIIRKNSKLDKIKKAEYIIKVQKRTVQNKRR